MGIITSRAYEDAVKRAPRRPAPSERRPPARLSAARTILAPRRFSVRASMKAVVVVLALGLAASGRDSVVVGQDKPAETGALDPRLKPLVGTWEGRVELKHLAKSKAACSSCRERAGRARGRFGLPARGLDPGRSSDRPRWRALPRSASRTTPAIPIASSCVKRRLALREDDAHRRYSRREPVRPTGR